MAETITHRRERIQKKTLYEMGYKYLCDNFHKFRQTEKIRIALEAYRLQMAKPLVDQSTHHYLINLVIPKEREQAFADRTQPVSV